MAYTDPNSYCIWNCEAEGEYEGQWANNQRQGFGTMRWKNGIKYEGNFNKDSRDQVSGTMWFASGEVYSGGWVSNLMHGEGSLTLTDGSCFRGQFCKGEARQKG